MLILASASPRRKELLSLITTDFTIEVPQVEEKVPAGTPPKEMVELLALQKARAIAQKHPKATVIGSDTVVALGNDILGKPKDKQDAFLMLKKLSGTTHQVFTGVAICYQGEEIVFAEATSVAFLSLTEKEILDYIATGEPMDKAGAYGIQGYGALFVKEIHGNYHSVMGLPVSTLHQFLRKSNNLTKEL